MFRAKYLFPLDGAYTTLDTSLPPWFTVFVGIKGLQKCSSVPNKQFYSKMAHGYICDFISFEYVHHVFSYSSNMALS